MFKHACACINVVIVVGRRHCEGGLRVGLRDLRGGLEGGLGGGFGLGICECWNYWRVDWDGSLDWEYPGVGNCANLRTADRVGKEASA